MIHDSLRQNVGGETLPLGLNFSSATETLGFSASLWTLHPPVWSFGKLDFAEIAHPIAKWNRQLPADTWSWFNIRWTSATSRYLGTNLRSQMMPIYPSQTQGENVFYRVNLWHTGLKVSGKWRVVCAPKMENHIHVVDEEIESGLLCEHDSLHPKNQEHLWNNSVLLPSRKTDPVFFFADFLVSDSRPQTHLAFEICVLQSPVSNLPSLQSFSPKAIKCKWWSSQKAKTQCELV